MAKPLPPKRSRFCLATHNGTICSARALDGIVYCEKHRTTGSVRDPVETLSPREWDIWHTVFANEPTARFSAECADRAVWRYRDHLASDEGSLAKNPKLERPK